MGEFFFRAIPDAKSCAPLFVIPAPGESGGILGVGDSVCVVLTRFWVCGLLLLPGRGAGRDVIARVGDAGLGGTGPGAGMWPGPEMPLKDLILFIYFAPVIG